MRNSLLAAVAGLTLAALRIAAVADEWPIPQNAEKARQARLENLAWGRRMLAEAYDKVGKKDPRWEAAVRELLKTAIPLFVRPQVAATHDEVFRPAKRAIDAGCDDPLVLYLHARSSTGRNLPDLGELDRRFAAASAALESSKYPAFLRADALVRAGCYKLFRPEETARKEAQRCFDAALALLPASVREDGLSPPAQRAWLAELLTLQQSLTWLNRDSKATFDRIDLVLRRIPAAKAIRLRLRGDFFTDYAWEARGSGFADTVTEDGWRKFAERAAEARNALQAAWDLDPTDGQTAARMITVEMAIGDGDRAEMERWFRRAMEADPDNLDACSRKLLWLEPKWHGSVEDMLIFARACRDTKNWGSGIPLILADAHRRVIPYLPPGEQAGYLKEPRVWDEIRGAFVDHLANDPGDHGVRSTFAGFCFLCGQFQEAHAQFQKLGDQLTGSGVFPENWLKEARFATAEKVHGDLKPGVPLASGFGVLEARYGTSRSWVDVTRAARFSIAGDRLTFTTNGLPDPIFGVRKALVVVYSVDGKVGLSTSAENQEVTLPPKDIAAGGLQEVPARGFAVLAARYGAEEHWADVTEAIRGRIKDGKLEASAAGLADPAYGIQKALVIVSARDGKVVVSTLPEDGTVSLPPAEPGTGH